MKILFVILGTAIVVFTLVQIYAMKSQSDIETYPYTVLESYEGFETREYAASLFTSVQLSTGDYNDGSSQGFSILAGYIFGGNDKNQKIAMTSPVAMSLEDSITMMFMVPKDLKKEELPVPNSDAIEITEVPSKRVAAIGFGGWANSEKIELYKSELIAALDKEGIAYTDSFFFLGYNAPYEVTNRLNEVIVELK